MVLQSGNNSQVKAENLRLCRATRVAGVMIFITPGSCSDPFQKLEEAGIPVIFFEKITDADNCNKVCLADEK